MTRLPLGCVEAIINAFSRDVASVHVYPAPRTRSPRDFTSLLPPPAPALCPPAKQVEKPYLPYGASPQCPLYTLSNEHNLLLLQLASVCEVLREV